MTIRVYKPTSAGRRFSSVNMHVEVTKKKPERSLLLPLQPSSGRCHQGVITVQHRGGRHKRMYRLVDFVRSRLDDPATVLGIEYDPNRSCHIALVQYANGDKSYLLAPQGLAVGATAVSGSGPVDPNPGNAMKMTDIPVGLDVHNIELVPGRGGQMCRSAASSARLMNKEGSWATLVLPSGEIRQVSVQCRATVGTLGNVDHINVRLGKAGRSRWLGIRPSVRGMAMSHHAHPMGGGSGRSKGNRPPCSATGVPAKGGLTRKHNKASKKRIIRRRRSRRYGQQKVR